MQPTDEYEYYLCQWSLNQMASPLPVKKGGVWGIGCSLVWVFELYLVFTFKIDEYNVNLKGMIVSSSLVFVVILKSEYVGGPNLNVLI